MFMIIFLILLLQIAGLSKSSTKNQFWNRSFHILSCNDNVGSTKRTKFNKTSKCYSSNSRFLKRKEWTTYLHNSVNNINNYNSSGSNTETQSLIKRRNKRSNCFQSTSLVVDSQWSSSTSWQNFLVFVVVVLLNITSTNCLQARQEGMLNVIFVLTIIQFTNAFCFIVKFSLFIFVVKEQKA